MSDAELGQEPRAMRTTAMIISSVISAVFALGCAQDDAPADDGAGSSDGTSGATGESGMSATTASTTAPGTTPADESSGDPAESESGDTAPGTTGAGECPTTPTRLVVLGDSILACFGAVIGPDSDTCSAKIFHEHVSATVGPVSYENLAVPGAVTHDVVTNQLDAIPVGMPGHVMLLIFIGGNDLSGYIISSDQDAIDGYAEKRPQLDADWAAIFEFLNDETNFPDGVTLVMNTQYNPFDDCTAPPYEVMSPVKTELINEYNDDLVAKAESQDGYIADQHAAYLGHGHHYATASCPSYVEGAEAWMFDQIHPNVAGHASLATVLAATADQIYAGCE
jgi:lysophospholipase L1-like esterase